MTIVTRSLRIKDHVFDIAGVSASDPYFTGLGDDHEPEFNRLCFDFVRDDDVCVDIGANIGMKSLLLSQYAVRGAVYAVEPAPTVAAVLRANVARGERRNITVIAEAVSDHDGVIPFHDESAFGHIAAEGVRVPVRTLASLMAGHGIARLDFVKIDVEGHELPILRSSMDLFERHRSLVLFEFNAWCQMARTETNPKQFAEWATARFSHLFIVRRGPVPEYLERVPAGGALELLHANFVRDGGVTDVLATNHPDRLRRVRGNTFPGLASAEAAQALKAALVERDAARAELARMRRSRSWRVTAPLRSLRRRLEGAMSGMLDRDVT